MTFATRMRFLLSTGELNGLRDLTIGPVKFIFKKPLFRQQAYDMFGYMLELQKIMPDNMSLGICVNIAAYLTDNSIYYTVRPCYDKDIGFMQNIRSVLSTHKLRKALIHMKNTKTCDGVPWILCCEAALANLKETTAKESN